MYLELIKRPAQLGLFPARELEPAPSHLLSESLSKLPFVGREAGDSPANADEVWGRERAELRSPQISRGSGEVASRRRGAGKRRQSKKNRAEI